MFCRLLLDSPNYIIKNNGLFSRFWLDCLGTFNIALTALAESFKISVGGMISITEQIFLIVPSSQSEISPNAFLAGTRNACFWSALNGRLLTSQRIFLLMKDKTWNYKNSKYTLLPFTSLQFTGCQGKLSIYKVQTNFEISEVQFRCGTFHVSNLMQMNSNKELRSSTLGSAHEQTRPNMNEF